MKTLLIAITAVTFLSSCGSGGCDTSTAQGASNCLCELMDEMVVVVDDVDQMKKLKDKGDKYEVEIEKAIDEGKYTENELEAILQDRNCYVAM